MSSETDLLAGLLRQWEDTTVRDHMSLDEAVR